MFDNIMVILLINMKSSYRTLNPIIHLHQNILTSTFTNYLRFKLFLFKLLFDLHDELFQTTSIDTSILSVFVNNVFVLF
jgi:hypothetical protein